MNYSSGLKRLQDDLEQAGIKVFYDLRDMQGHLDSTIKENLQNSDFILPILTPKFLERIQNSDSKLAYEFKLTLEKAQAHPGSVLPILRSGTFNDLKHSLASLAEYLIYTITPGVRMEPLLIGLSSPCGMIPVIYGIRIGDREYHKILSKWLDGCLIRLPQLLPNVIERSAILNQLAIGFRKQGEKKQAPVQIIQGMGGVGKTELATVYANRWSYSQGFVRWVYADSFNLTNEWLHLGELLGLDLKGLTQVEQRYMIRQALQKRSHWLIVLDNLENQSALAELLPQQQTPTQQILITTRSENWGRFPVLNLPEFTADECEIYWASFLTAAQRQGAKKLAEALGYLPLAMSHAVAYMQQTGLDAETYLNRFQKAGIALLGDENKTDSDVRYQHTVLTTWQLSIDELDKKNNKSAEVIKFCAYLHSDGIEEHFLQILLDMDELILDKCFKIIRDYGLLTRENSGFKIHRLVQDAIRYRETAIFKETLFKVRIKPLADMLFKLYHFEKQVKNYPKLRSLQPHVDKIRGFIPTEPYDKDQSICEGALLGIQGDFFLNISGEANKALECYQKILLISLEIYQDEPGYIATSYDNLGEAYRILGDATSAMECFQRALVIWLDICGEEHSYVAACYNQIGNIKFDLGEFQDAINWQEKALAIYLKVYGEKCLEVSIVYSNLGSSRCALGDAITALRNHEKALAIRKDIEGEDSPELAMIHYNLGNAHFAMKHHQLAADFYDKALELALKFHGEEHPFIAGICNSVGSLLSSSGDIQSAIMFHEHSLMINLKAYGEKHHSVANNYNNLGSAYFAFDNLQSALSYYEKSLSIFLKIYEKKHPDIAKVYNNLASVYDALGNTQLALEYRKKAIAIKD